MKLAFPAFIALIIACITIQTLAAPGPGKKLWDRIKGGKSEGSSSSSSSEKIQTFARSKALENHETFMSRARAGLHNAAAAKKDTLDHALLLRLNGQPVTTSVHDGSNQDYIDSVERFHRDHGEYLSTLQEAARAHEADLQGTDKLKEAQLLSYYAGHAENWLYDHPEDQRGPNYNRYTGKQMTGYRSRIDEMLHLLDGGTPETFVMGDISARHSSDEARSEDGD